MKLFSLNDMIKGWFVGDFDPVAVPAKDVEVAVKYYKKGDYEAVHHHRVATECTVIAKGRARFGDEVYGEGCIVVLAPGDATDFEAIEDDTITVVVKMPSVIGDKYPGRPGEG